MIRQQNRNRQPLAQFRNLRKALHKVITFPELAK